MILIDFSPVYHQEPKQYVLFAISKNMPVRELSVTKQKRAVRSVNENSKSDTGLW